MPFVKGQSGNPGGRPSVVADVRDLARAYTEEAVQTLASVMRNDEAAPAARVAAATAILDRGYGKPAQTINANVSRNARDLTDDELFAIAAGSGARTAASQGGEETAH